MSKKILIIFVSLIILVSCGGDPETTELKHYVTADLYNIRTHLRAATHQYDSTMSKNEKARADIIRTKVVTQYDKYLQGLLKIKTDTVMVDALNETGIQSVEAAIESLDKYRKIALRGNAHQTLRARADAENAMESVRSWQKEVWEAARARDITVPDEISR